MSEIFKIFICIAILTGCATTPTPEQEYKQFMNFCHERVINHQYHEGPVPHDIEEYTQFMYNMGLFHGCLHGIMDWHWFRKEKRKYGSGK